MMLETLRPFFHFYFQQFVKEEVFRRPWLLGIFAGMFAALALHFLNQRVYRVLVLFSDMQSSGFYWLLLLLLTSFFLFLRWFRIHRKSLGITALSISVGAFCLFHVVKISLSRENTFLDWPVLNLWKPDQWQYLLPILYGLSFGLLAFPFSALLISFWKSSIALPTRPASQRPELTGLYWVPEDLNAEFFFMKSVRSSASMNLVFVHGVDGHYRRTWENDSGGCWPRWVAASFPNVAVACYQYAAATISWRGSAMSLEDRAANLCSLIRDTNLLEKKTLFVAHSFGGLVLKRVWQKLKQSNTAEGRDNFYGVIFLSTPHGGSILAEYLLYVSRWMSVLNPNKALVTDLLRNSKMLGELDRWYWSDPPLLNRIYYETAPTAGYQVVSAESAKPSNCLDVEATPLDCDHIQIAKPENPHVQLVLGINRIIQQALS